MGQEKAQPAGQEVAQPSHGGTPQGETLRKDEMVSKEETERGDHEPWQKHNEAVLPMKMFFPISNLNLLWHSLRLFPLVLSFVP